MTEAAAEASDSGSVSGARPGDAVAGVGIGFPVSSVFMQWSAAESEGGIAHRAGAQCCHPRRRSPGSAVGVARVGVADRSEAETERSEKPTSQGSLGAEQGWRFAVPSGTT